MSLPTDHPAAANATSAGPSTSLPVIPRGQPPIPRRLHSADLFGTEQQIEIEHGDAVYRLRRTALGKLILTK